MRVVAGEFKGHRLAGPSGGGTRPTSDRVREALFSILGNIEGARVLDLFAGTGALAIEALSRGAGSAVLVERDRATARVADENITRILQARASSAKLVRGEALRYLESSPAEAFDLVLIDPPYKQAQGLAPELSMLLPAVLSAGARVVFECERREPAALDEAHFTELSEHRYGDTLLRIFQPDE